MYYIRYLDMFRAIICSSSGGENCISQHLVCHSLGVAVQCTGWEWTAVRSQPVSNVIHILQNKETVHQVGNKNKFILWCTVRKTSNYWVYITDLVPRC
jgi:hypothetical protein